MNKRLKKFVSDTFKSIAIDLSKNPSQLKEKLRGAKSKLNKESVIEALGPYVNDVKVLVRLIKCWVSGSYKDVSYQTIIWAIIGVIYFLNPADLLPDIILGLGFLDDIAVIRWILKHFKNDIQKFKEWEKSQTEGR